MKKQLLNLILTLLCFTGFAQEDPFPMPSTRIYGNLTVDSSFYNQTNGNYLFNASDVADFFGQDAAGMLRLFGGGKMLNVIGDFSALGLSGNQAIIGYINGSSRGSVIFIDSTRMSFTRNDADTIVVMNLNGNNSSVDQLFTLQGQIPSGGPVGFEAQINPGGPLTAKMFATNFNGSTNLSVIEVDSTSIDLVADDGAVTATVNINGLVVPSLPSEPTGQNGAIYYNTVSNVMRVYENGAWRDL